MKIQVIQSILVNSKHVNKYEQIEVDEKVGEYLISINRAIKVKEEIKKEEDIVNLINKETNREKSIKKNTRVKKVEENSESE